VVANGCLVMITQKFILVLSGIYGMVAVILGAFGAHGLKGKLDPSSSDAFETAVRYQFYHALALMMIGLLYSQLQSGALRSSAVCIMLGTILFSGSLYFLSIRTILPFGELRFLGPVTPLGGLLLIIGWLLFIVAAARTRG